MAFPARQKVLDLLPLVVTKSKALHVEVNVLLVESEQEVFTAMIAVKEGRGSFADALIGALGTKVGWSYTVTFDQKALRLPAFRRV
jgi:predicted nucleic-acid-binding protein